MAIFFCTGHKDHPGPRETSTCTCRVALALSNGNHFNGVIDTHVDSKVIQIIISIYSNTYLFRNLYQQFSFHNFSICFMYPIIVRGNFWKPSFMSC